jgi:hypothetical protein
MTLIKQKKYIFGIIPEKISFSAGKKPAGFTPEK